MIFSGVVQMSEEKKTGEDLYNEPDVGFADQSGMTQMETPFRQAIDLLAVTHGQELELFSRATYQIAAAARIGYNMVFRFGSRYIEGQTEQLERLSVSIRGSGRDEIVRSLQAGSGVPDAYYEMQSGSNKGFVEE